MLLVGRLQCLVKEHKWFVLLFMRVIYVCLMAAMLHQCRDKPALVNMLQLKHESNHVFIKFSYYKNVISASSREQHIFICNRPSKKSLQYICCVTHKHTRHKLTYNVLFSNVSKHCQKPVLQEIAFPWLHTKDPHLKINITSDINFTIQEITFLPLKYQHKDT